MSRELTKNESRALELSARGKSLTEIARDLGYKAKSSAARTIARAREKAALLNTESKNDSHVGQLTSLLESLLPKASGGDLRAVDRVMAIMDQIRRLTLDPGMVAYDLRDAVQVTVDKLKEKGQIDSEIDAGLMKTALTIAERIDVGIHLGESRIVYLAPHLINSLREMGATPVARAQIESLVNGRTDGVDGGGKLAKIVKAANDLRQAA